METPNILVLSATPYDPSGNRKGGTSFKGRIIANGIEKEFDFGDQGDELGLMSQIKEVPAVYTPTFTIGTYQKKAVYDGVASVKVNLSAQITGLKFVKKYEVREF